MKRVTETFLLPCTPPVFWRVFLDQAYVKALYLEGLGFADFNVIEWSESSRRLRIVPKLNLPAVLSKLIGDAFAYEEHGSLDRLTSVWTWQMAQAAGSKSPLSSLVSTRGSFRVVADGTANCVRTDELVIEGKLFGLGGLIESSAEKEARTAWGKERVFLAKWLAAMNAKGSAG